MTYASYLYDLRQYSYRNYCSTYVRVLQYLAESTGKLQPLDKILTPGSEKDSPLRSINRIFMLYLQNT